MSTELKITKERVLVAAKSCPDADRILKKLFPEAFEEDVSDMHMKRFHWRGDKSKTCIVLTGPSRVKLFQLFFPGQVVGSFLIVNLSYDGSVNGYASRRSFLENWERID